VEEMRARVLKLVETEAKKANEKGKTAHHRP
jgi:hypothetical protein